MLNEYKVTCPKCDNVKAVNCRELNSTMTQLTCARCGFAREYRLSRIDEQTARDAFGYAKQRFTRRMGRQYLKRVWIPAIIILGFALQYHDAKTTWVLAILLIVHEFSPVAMELRTQMPQVIRLIDKGNFADGELNRYVMTGELDFYDIVRNYETAAAFHDETDERLLAMRYDAYRVWLGARLRAHGCDQKEIDEEMISFGIYLNEKTPKS